MNCLSEGYKQAVDKICGNIATNGFSGQKTSFRAQKKRSFLDSNHVLATTEKSCANKKVPFSQKKYQFLKKFWAFFWVKMHLQPKNTFPLNVKTAVSPQFRPGLVHNCTIFICSLDVRNIVQGGNPLYAGFFFYTGLWKLYLTIMSAFFCKKQLSRV